MAPTRFGEGGGDGRDGSGGNASATSTAMTSDSGAALSSANSTGGAGGPAVQFGGSPPAGGGGGAANAESAAISGRSGDATSSAIATGGAAALPSQGSGGDAIAGSAATSNGSGNASSSASAIAGSSTFNFFPHITADAAAMANASATGGGTAIVKAVAMAGSLNFSGGSVDGAANATSNAETAKGALAQAQSTALGSSGQAQSTAKTSLAGVSVQSSAVAPTSGSTATTNAIAQGGAGQTFANPGQTAYAFSTASPNKGYAASLIGGASNVAGALLGPRDAVFGAAILGANYATDGGGASQTYSGSATFDFGYGGDLMLGLIDDQDAGFPGGLGFQSMEFTILDNGVEILDVTFESLAVAESFFHDSVINLGSNLGPDIDLTFGYNLVADGSGGFGFDFAVGGAVPEPSTWAIMLIGFAGLGFAGYRASRKNVAVTV
jgi:hypothetical protein